VEEGSEVVRGHDDHLDTAEVGQQSTAPLVHQEEWHAHFEDLEDTQAGGDQEGRSHEQFHPRAGRVRCGHTLTSRIEGWWEVEMAMILSIWRSSSCLSESARGNSTEDELNALGKREGERSLTSSATPMALTEI
jgi:hypothetical protein